MSQFFGYIALNAQINISDVAAQMTNSMSFFQGDAIGVYQTNEVFICNKFLFNTPESVNTTNIYQNERYVLAATCRVDNREKLATKISIENPLKASDHEYILAAYTYYQEKCVEHLLGDFSFVVWDKKEQTLFMAKDHLGIKPLFYYFDENFLLFSTNIHCIKAVKGANLALDELYIARELKNFSATFQDTFFQYIKRLKPAHFIKFCPPKSNILEQRYWELSPVDISAFKTEEEIYEELRRLFTEAVVCRTRTTKNIGCQLSGGLDSSAIAVLLARNIDKNRLHTYSFVLSDKTRPYSEKGIDEQETQNIIIEYADLLKENHHKIEDFHYKDVFEELEASNLIMGGYSSSDCIWQDTMFKKAGENKVGYIMSGFPGDECVSNSGSLYYYEYLGNRNWKELFKLIKNEKIKGLRKIGSYLKAKYYGTYRIAYRDIQNQRNLLNPQSPYNQLLKVDKEAFKFHPTFKEYLKNQICRPHTCHRTESEGLYATQYSMETVYPLADIRLLQFTYSISAYLFAPKKLSRMLFRNICKNILPDSVRLQTKYNGAMTLAFAEYWHKQQITSLSQSILVNKLRLYNLSAIEFETSYNIKDNEDVLVIYKVDNMIIRNNFG
jgi:asparagine synthase (glutamine-hydrolysing)